MSKFTTTKYRDGRITTSPFAVRDKINPCVYPGHRISGFSMSTNSEKRVILPVVTLKIPCEIYNTLLYIRQEVHPNAFAFEGIVIEEEECSSEGGSEGKVFRLKKIYIPPQTVRPGHVEYDILTCDIAPEKELEYLTLHGHSHAGIGAFWSAEDEEDIADWMGPYRFNLVMDDRGKLLARIDFFTEFGGEILHVAAGEVNVKLEFSSDFEETHSGLLDNIKQQECFEDSPGRSPQILGDCQVTAGKDGGKDYCYEGGPVAWSEYNEGNDDWCCGFITEEGGETYGV